MSEKKRKRRDDGVERPSKKTAIAPPPGNVRVEFVEDTDISGPVLATTPGLTFPSKIEFKPYATQGQNPELLLQSSDHPRLDYTAQEEKDGSSESLLKDYLGVFDPATNKLKLVEVKRVTVRSSLRSEKEELAEANARIAAAKATMTARRHALAAEFGSKKSRKAIQDITENAIMRGKAGDPSATPKNEAVASAVLDNMASTTSTMPTKDELAAAIDASKPRPPVNLNAAYASEVYPINTVIGPELMGVIAVKDWVEKTDKGESIELSSKFVAQRVVKLVRNKEITKLKALRFIQACINFNMALKGRAKGPRMVPHKDKLVPAMGDAPAPVVDGIRRKFASENNDLTSWHTDNLMTHIAAAALFIDDFEVDVNDLRDDLRVENKEIKQYFAELGCRITAPSESERTRLKISKAEAVNHFFAKLRVPLSLPKVKTGGRRK
ncbi:DNA-directed RNA polymeras-like protein I 49 kDa polypeptide [Lophiotrema nucula]|uniref:DNA-directed RNA polymeras-like protein I 49 kDa polypeptide n=1 Tax=Lophiotrema nucula TaxID=690887 RepID=A0A6A5Z7C7_9PLEO|nr:DNA-directed RNA polymeras-like protein I 49 kDa polypeptide [Lophiotrema nucula]